MHPSYFSASDEIDEMPSAVLELSAELSEWLFHIKLWDGISDGTDIDLAQFEEANLSGVTLRKAYEAVAGVKGMLMKSASTDIAFRYGWDASKDDLRCRLGVRTALKELQELLALFKSAADRNQYVYCQL